MKFNAEQIKKAKKAQNAEELFEMAKAENIEMTIEEAKTYFDKLQGNAELSDDELSMVAGGKEGSAPKYSRGDSFLHSNGLTVIIVTDPKSYDDTYKYGYRYESQSVDTVMTPTTESFFDGMVYLGKYTNNNK